MSILALLKEESKIVFNLFKHLMSALKTSIPVISSTFPITSNAAYACSLYLYGETSLGAKT